MSSRTEKNALRLSTSCLQIVQNYHKETPFLSGTIRVQSGRNVRSSRRMPMQAMKTAHLGRKPMLRLPLKKHCPPANARQQPRRRTDYQQPPNSRKCLGVLIHRQRRFLLLSTALPVFAFLAECSTRPPAQAGGLVRCTGADERQFRIRACGACFPAGRPACPARCSGGRAGGAVRPR